MQAQSPLRSTWVVGKSRLLVITLCDLALREAEEAAGSEEAVGVTSAVSF